MSAPFQVDLRGIVDLLSHHLYSGPRVYLRELTQNAADALTARVLREPETAKSTPPRITITPADVSPDGRFHLDDNGVGLTREDIDRFLGASAAPRNGESARRPRNPSSAISGSDCSRASWSRTPSSCAPGMTTTRPGGGRPTAAAPTRWPNPICLASNAAPWSAWKPAPNMPIWFERTPSEN
ncbi:hypothetical protein [Austwickia chelonae]|uniref:hypothetical protein n=1 Tax=Austwickia chelonae TaxID=100225 RepID=UPI0013C36353|nr:hypothetical protein [Austwickia chelonae]